MDLSFRMGRGTGSQSPCTGLERKRRTVPSVAGFADPAGRKRPRVYNAPVHITSL